jgi:thiamine-phosphate pyrophosphorylase
VPRERPPDGAGRHRRRRRRHPASRKDDLGCRLRRIFIVNDRPDIAAIVGADGVHLGQGDLPIAEARRLLRPGAIVGRSTHTIEQARAAVNEGADYISVGPMFPSKTKDAGPIAGPELLKQAVAEITLPIIAIGGINPDNAAQLVAAGAKILAVSSAVCSAPDPKAAASEIKEQITRSEPNQ